MNIAIFLRTALKPNISNANLDKNKRKLFLYFDNSCPNQTNTANTTIASYIFNIKESLKKTDEKNVVLSTFNSAISWSNTGNYIVKTCWQKLHMSMWFIIHLNTFARAWARARSIAHLSWKGLHFPVNIAKILRAAFFIEHIWSLLLDLLRNLLKITVKKTIFQ